MSRVRFLGFTDVVLACDHCAKPDLRRTVVLELLDDDGNGTGEVVHYGTTCAARALADRGADQGNAARVVRLAEEAHHATIEAARDSASQLRFYGVPLAGRITATQVLAVAIRYAEAHAAARWHTDTTAAGWCALVEEMIARRQAAIADAALLGFHP